MNVMWERVIAEAGKKSVVDIVFISTTGGIMKEGKKNYNKIMGRKKTKIRSSGKVSLTACVRNKIVEQKLRD